MAAEKSVLKKARKDIISTIKFSIIIESDKIIFYLIRREVCQLATEGRMLQYQYDVLSSSNITARYIEK